MTELPSVASGQTFSWPEGARLALSIVVNVEEGAERSVADGDSGPEPVDELGIALKGEVRNFSNESNYRYGIQRGAPRVLDMLRLYGVPATFTCAALSLERAPQLARQIVDEGHEICAHGWRWTYQHRMSEEDEREFIAKASDSILNSCGLRPEGWLSRYLTSANTARLLAEAGFSYHMDDYSDDKPFWQRQGDRSILVLPYAVDTNDMKLWTTPAYSPSDWLQYAVDTFDCLYEEGRTQPRMMSLGLHLRVIGRPGRIGALKQFLEHVRSQQAVWLARRIDIARWWSEHHPSSN